MPRLRASRLWWSARSIWPRRPSSRWAAPPGGCAARCARGWWSWQRCRSAPGCWSASWRRGERWLRCSSAVWKVATPPRPMSRPRGSGCTRRKASLQSSRLTRLVRMGELAAALAVPIESLRAAQLDFSELATLPDALGERDARGEALRNRVDMRQRLLEFSAADADVKLEIARQYPTVSLRPGYLWDQGDNVWLLAVDLLAPPLLGNAPAIAVAQARRETAAQIALRDQAAIIAETDTALAAYRQSVAGARAAHQASLVQLARSGQAQKQFDAGYADRVETTQARLEAVAVERNLMSAQTGAQRALGTSGRCFAAPALGRSAARLRAACAGGSRGAMKLTRSAVIIAVMAAIIAVLAWALVYYARDEFQLQAEGMEDEIPTESTVGARDGYSTVAVSPESQKASGIETARLEAARGQASAEVYGTVIDLHAAVRPARALPGGRFRSARTAGGRGEQPRRVRAGAQALRGRSQHRRARHARRAGAVEERRSPRAGHEPVRGKPARRVALGLGAGGVGLGRGPRLRALRGAGRPATKCSCRLPSRSICRARPGARRWRWRRFPRAAPSAWRASSRPRRRSTRPCPAPPISISPAPRDCVRACGSPDESPSAEVRAMVCSSPRRRWSGTAGAPGPMSRKKPTPSCAAPSTPAQEAPGGWFTAAGFEAGEQVVVRGPQLLLSEELKFQIRNENED